MPFSARRAFTLIELLVVIAIIAILAAILFPVFAQAKEAAKKTACLSNVKQIGLGTMMYLGDSDDVFPIQYSQNGDIYQFWWYSYDGATGTTDPKGGLLQPYLKNTQISLCPSTPSNLKNGYDDKAKPSTSYGVNTIVTDLRNGTPAYSGWERPAESLMVAEAADLYDGTLYETLEIYPVYDDTSFYSPNLQSRHGTDSVNITWMDGHANSKKLTYATEAMSPKAAGWKKEHLGFIPGPGGIAPLATNPQVNFYYVAQKPTS